MKISGFFAQRRNLRGLMAAGLLGSLSLSLPIAAPAEAQRAPRLEITLRAAVALDPDLDAFDRARRYEPIWVRRGQIIPEADRLIEVIRATGRDGDFLADLVEQARGGSPSALAEAEWRLSRAFLAHARQANRPSAGMVYVDPALAPVSREFQPRQLRSREGLRASLESLGSVNPIFAQLRQGLNGYRTRWGALPQIQISAGPTLRKGSRGERVAMLRRRLGLPEEGRFDDAVDQAVKAYQQAHGLPADGIVGRGTITSLNRGAPHYERLILANMERARAIPANPGRRYIVVDAGAQKLWMYENGRVVDEMKVIVGKPTEQTPVMASPMRYAILNPYWNVPYDLVQRRIAPAVVQYGLPFLRERRYEVLSDWTDNAVRIDPARVDWAAVAAGRQEVRVRQLPGQDNFMGDIKFEMPNEHGIYLHDTPDRQLFNEAERSLSSGCVRVEDAQRLARWLFGRPLVATSSQPEQRVDLPEPVPVYITYLTASPSAEGIAFRSDVYGLDEAVQSASLN
jgi:murein L,D-transpeptidase YcbB/YkuD